MDEIGFERFMIQKICDYPCSNKFELKQGEGIYICQIGTLNMRVAGRTFEQYRKTSEFKEAQKEYYEINKIEINKKIDCVCGCEIFKRNLNHHEKSPKHIKLIELNKNFNNEVVVWYYISIFIINFV